MRERFERWRARRALRRFAPLEPSSPEGAAVRISGVVRVHDETVTAPLSGIEGVIVRTSVRGASRFKGNNPGANHNLLVCKPFVVEVDEQSRAIVDGGHVVLGIPRVDIAAVGIDRKEAYLARTALRWPAAFHETVLVPGAHITVGGVLMRDVEYQPPTDERVFREQLPPGLRLVGGPDHPLVIVEVR